MTYHLASSSHHEIGSNKMRLSIYIIYASYPPQYNIQDIALKTNSITCSETKKGDKMARAITQHPIRVQETMNFAAVGIVEGMVDGRGGGIIGIRISSRHKHQMNHTASPKSHCSHHRLPSKQSHVLVTSWESSVHFHWLL